MATASRKVTALIYDAPLGAALFGLKVGEYAEELQLGDRQFDLEIVALHSSRTTKDC